MAHGPDERRVNVPDLACHLQAMSIVGAWRVGEEVEMKKRKDNELVPSGDPASQDETLRPKPSHGDPTVHAQSSREALEQRESGQPGGGAGRRDDVGRSGVYPISGDERPSGGAELRPLGDWAGGDRGIAGYEDSGGSELVMRDGVVLGGLTSDGAGRPTIDIHGGATGAGGQREPGEPTTPAPPGPDTSAAERAGDERGKRR